MPKSDNVHTGRSFDRLINFTDAVVAVAITVLVLPIVDLRAKGAEQTVWSIMNDNLGQIMTFIWTFIVVALMWQVHNRVFSRLAGFDQTIFWLNIVWLLAVVFLPWSSVMYGTGIDGTEAGASSSMWSGGEGLGGAGLLYWTNLAVISLVTSGITLHARRHPELIDQTSPRIFRDTTLTRSRGVIFGVYFLITGLATLVIPQIAVWFPLGLFVLGPIIARQEVGRE
jgi:uncharacterized membrane protein